MADIGAYTPETARMILETVRYLRASGLLSDGKQPAIFPGSEPIYVKNDSGEEVPAYGLMQITGSEEIDGRNYITIEQYDETADGELLFNGTSAIPDTEYGVAQHGPIYLAQGDGTAATAGDLWGPQDADWEVTDEGTSLVAIGDDDVAEGVVKLTRVGGSGGFVFKSPSGGIAAMSGTTPGKATCDLYVVDSNDSLVDTTLNKSVYNIFSSSIAGDTYGTAKAIRGKLIADAEDCPASAGSSNPT